MFPINKNSYLQRAFPLNPRLINRIVNTVRDIEHDRYDFEPPIERVVSAQPCIPIEKVDVTRAKVAFGRWALPKLKLELHSDDFHTMACAINSISDLVHDPEKTFEAIKLCIVERLMELMLHEDESIRERVCIILYTVATQAAGAERIVQNKDILTNLSLLIDDDNNYVRIKAAGCIEMIAFSILGSGALIEKGFITTLIKNLTTDEENEVLVYHLKSLYHLTYGEGKLEAYESNVLPIVIKLMEKDDQQVTAHVLELMSRIMTHKPAQQFANDTLLLKELLKLIFDKRDMVYKAAVKTIPFCTHTTIGKKIAANLILDAVEQPDIVKQLITIAHNVHQPYTQMFVLKGLTNIAQHPRMRKELREKYLEAIYNIGFLTRDPIRELRRCKKRLVEVITWRPD